MKFNELDIRPEILKSIDLMGYETPSPIQEQAIPVILNNQDVIGLAQTGTGKTAAFAIPILQRLSLKKSAGRRNIRTLILTPTRELAVQIHENFEAYGKFLHLKSCVVFGGVKQASQVSKLRNGVDIVIATPGRLVDLYKQGYVHLEHTEVLVLDEADRMLDMGFAQDVNKIVGLTPKTRQTLLFSATMPKEIKDFANSILKEPFSIEVTPVSTPAESVSQELYHVDGINKPQLLRHILKDPTLTQVLVFTKTKYGADKVVKELIHSNIKSMAIHGNKSQNARQTALKDFKKGNIRVLVATDIAARGIDISELPMVINYDLPNMPETYVHRIGRTGRAGFSGKSISFANFDELSYVKEIQKLIGKAIPLAENNPFPMESFLAKPKQKTGREQARNRVKKDFKPTENVKQIKQKPTENKKPRQAEPKKAVNQKTEKPKFKKSVKEKLVIDFPNSKKIKNEKPKTDRVKQEKPMAKAKQEKAKSNNNFVKTSQNVKGATPYTSNKRKAPKNKT